MTNEEKSIKIALDQNKRATELADVYACVFQGCLEMAEWKEQQMIDKASEWLESEATKHIGFDCITEEPSLCYDFVELLIKAMKDE